MLLFVRQPIRFRTSTASRLSALSRPDQLRQLSSICRDNTRSLLLAVETVRRLGIGAFRISSPLFPCFTHPGVGYSIDDLPNAADFPPCWHPLTATVDVEAKAKELAVLKLMKDLGIS